MKKAFFLYCLFGTMLSYGQEKLIKDLDGDKVVDTVFLDIESNKIVCRLSVLRYQTIRSKEIELEGDKNGIRATKNGFEFWSSFMRAGHACQFRYNAAANKIQLIGMSEYEFGNAMNDGSGEGSLNLLTNTYIGEWNYYDENKQKLLKLPAIKQKITLGKIYLDRFDSKIIYNFQERSAALYEKQKALSKITTANK